MEGVIDRRGGQGEVDREREPRVCRRGDRGEAAEALDEFGPACRLDLEAGCTGMPAMADEEIAARLERRPEIQRAVAPA